MLTNLVAPSVRPRIMALPNAPYIHVYANIRDCATEQATKPGLDILNRVASMLHIGLKMSSLKV